MFWQSSMAACFLQQRGETRALAPSGAVWIGRVVEIMSIDRGGGACDSHLMSPPVISGAEGAVFSKSVETSHVRAEPFKELR
ncbi:hypothetical protein D4764_14G0012800 [Takifugu flavidus]|uniref:Uncharacterized protein n=1 Tax=Takifugu flavidus TaxID=433684 RepID=A0A5C6PAU5_9TELE|nr:hypothetical protein D4764_14G0012800 [Takifugu flavidus]